MKIYELNMNQLGEKARTLILVDDDCDIKNFAPHVFNKMSELKGRRFVDLRGKKMLGNGNVKVQ